MTKSTKNSATPTPPPLAISIPEILLFASYFLAVWLVPVEWIDSLPGVIAHGIASKINPYLSEYSTAFAADPKYFVHCHVLATWMIAPFVYPLIIRRNGGLKAYANVVQKDMEKYGGAGIYVPVYFICFGALYFGMLQFVDYPLTRGEWAIWVGGVSYSAFMLLGVLSLWVGTICMAMYTHWNFQKGDDR